MSQGKRRNKTKRKNYIKDIWFFYFYSLRTFQSLNISTFTAVNKLNQYFYFYSSICTCTAVKTEGTSDFWLVRQRLNKSWRWNVHFWGYIWLLWWRRHFCPETVKTLTLESVAQSLRRVDPWHTTRLSSGAPGSPAHRGQRSLRGKHVDVTVGQRGQKWMRRRRSCWDRKHPRAKLVSQHSIVSAQRVILLNTSCGFRDRSQSSLQEEKVKEEDGERQILLEPTLELTRFFLETRTSD